MPWLYVVFFFVNAAVCYWQVLQSPSMVLSVAYAALTMGIHENASQFTRVYYWSKKKNREKQVKVMDGHEHARTQLWICLNWTRTLQWTPLKTSNRNGEHGAEPAAGLGVGRQRGGNRRTRPFGFEEIEQRWESSDRSGRSADRAGTATPNQTSKLIRCSP